MKIVLIGAGSYVFGPTVLLDAIEKHRIQGELVLVDLNLEAAELMAAAGQRMAQVLGVDCRVTATADRRAALPEADSVILSAAPQGARRWQMDYDILKRAGMPDQARECGGLGGLSYSLRSISLALDVCEDMAQLCPQAGLLNVTNPLPRVITAVHRFTDIGVYGFCNVAWGGAHGYEWLGRMVGRPFDRLDVVTAGLNHFAWLVSSLDQETGEDLYPVVEQVIRAGQDRHYVLWRRWLDTYGAITVVASDHVAEYLPFDPDASYATTPPYHGDMQEREARQVDLRAIGAGECRWDMLRVRGSWEHPVDVALAIATGSDLAVDMLNLPNRGYLPDIPDDRIVEVPATVQNGQVRGVYVGGLPGQVGALCRAVSDVHELVAEGAAKGNRQVLQQAIEVDPAIADKAAAVRVLAEILAAHRDILPRFSQN